MSASAKKKTIPVEARVRLNAYAVIQAAVEEGVLCGIRRAHKHTDAPGEDVVAEHVEREVMGALCDVLTFGDES